MMSFPSNQHAKVLTIRLKTNKEKIRNTKANHKTSNLALV